jgi:hypothetical protein
VYGRIVNRDEAVCFEKMQKLIQKIVGVVSHKTEQVVHIFMV